MAHKYCKWYVWTGACGALSRHGAVWLHKKGLTPKHMGRALTQWQSGVNNSTSFPPPTNNAFECTITLQELRGFSSVGMTNLGGDNFEAQIDPLKLVWGGGEECHYVPECNCFIQI